MRRRYELWALVPLLIAALAPSAAASSTAFEKPPTASVAVGAEFASGAYGTGTRTRSLYLPFVASWFPGERFDASIEIPFLYQNNRSVTTTLYRNPQPVTAGESLVTGGGTGGVRRGGPGGAAGAPSSSSVLGLGDIVLRVGVVAVAEGLLPQIRPNVFVKVPTASRSDGIGTGEFDVGTGIELTKWYRDLHLLAEGSYVYQGKAAGYGLKDYLSYAGGVGYRLAQRVEPMVFVKGASAPSHYSSELLELRLRVVWSVTRSTSLDFYGSRGFAESSPDYGTGLSVVRSF